MQQFFKQIVNFLRDLTALEKAAVSLVFVAFFMLGFKLFVKHHYNKDKAKLKIGPILLMAISTAGILFIFLV